MENSNRKEQRQKVLTQEEGTMQQPASDGALELEQPQATEQASRHQNSAGSGGPEHPMVNEVEDPRKINAKPVKKVPANNFEMGR